MSAAASVPPAAATSEAETVHISSAPVPTLVPALEISQPSAWLDALKAPSINGERQTLASQTKISLCVTCIPHHGTVDSGPIYQDRR
ncbi:hypothetical protein GCM10010489_08330 [Microbacterium saperdae]|nr:hypothetical protein GCM10010489_08330 [Microbacterium saperdae]